MRWFVTDPSNREESAERNLTIEKIDSWWCEFQLKSSSINDLFEKKCKWNLPEWMAQHLSGIDGRLMWEFGPAVSGLGHRLVITPESSHHLRPLVNTILRRAPKIHGWEFYAYRLPEDYEKTLITTEVRAKTSVADYNVRVQKGENNYIDLCFFSPSIPKQEDQQSLGAAFVTSETLLGEECLDKWIGAIKVSPLPTASGLKSIFGLNRRPLPNLISLKRLKDTVDSVSLSIRDQLPPKPHYERIDEAKWTAWNLEPEEADDYAEQRDLFVGTSANADLWAAAHRGGLFFSERFTRHQEIFCYLKLDGSEGLDEEKFADKSEIEDVLNAVLIPNKLGCCIGGGTGLRYSYINLAIVDLKQGIAAVRKVLRAGNVPKRTWIQFFDADMAAEWIGIYDDSPSPPMPDFDG